MAVREPLCFRPFLSLVALPARPLYPKLYSHPAGLDCMILPRTSTPLHPASGFPGAGPVGGQGGEWDERT